MARHHCPSCGVPLAQDEYEGGVCPVCDTQFRPATTQGRFTERMPLPPANGLGGGDKSPAWNSVETGVNLIYVGMVTVLICSIMGGCCVSFSSLERADVRRAAIQSVTAGFSCLPALAMFAGVLLTIIGQFMCCSVPEPSGGRNMIVASTTCVCLGLILNLLQIMLIANSPISPRPGPASQGYSLTIVGFTAFAALIRLAGVILFVLFLRNVARYFHKESLARSCSNFVIFTIILGALGILGGSFLVGALVSGASNFHFILHRVHAGGLSTMAGCSAIVIVLGLLLWFLNLLRLTRNTIRDRLVPRPRYDRSFDI